VVVRKDRADYLMRRGLSSAIVVALGALLMMATASATLAQGSSPQAKKCYFGECNKDDPVSPVPPPPPPPNITNITGKWRDNFGFVSEIRQNGDSFTFTVQGTCRCALCLS